MPGSFIPLAEESGFIVSLGAWVMEQAIKEAAHWMSCGTPLVVSVNVSALEFRQPGFVERITALLTRYGLPAQQLELELTESVLLHDAQEMEQVLASLTRQGLRLSIDDFGTGYSSLTYLKRLPIHKVKIDKSFVDDLNGWDERSAIFGAIIDLSHGMGLLVVAEGVEREDQRKALIKHSCDQIQGYLISRPVSESEVCKLLEILN